MSCLIAYFLVTFYVLTAIGVFFTVSGGRHHRGRFIFAAMWPIMFGCWLGERIDESPTELEWIRTELQALNATDLTEAQQGQREKLIRRMTKILERKP